MVARHRSLAWALQVSLKNAVQLPLPQKLSPGHSSSYQPAEVYGSGQDLPGSGTVAGTLWIRLEASEGASLWSGAAMELTASRSHTSIPQSGSEQSAGTHCLCWVSDPPSRPASPDSSNTSVQSVSGKILAPTPEPTLTVMASSPPLKALFLLAPCSLALYASFCSTPKCRPVLSAWPEASLPWDFQEQIPCLFAPCCYF